MKHEKDIAKFLERGDFEMTDEGLLVHRAIRARGRYVHTVNGQDEQSDHNLIPAAGILHILDVVFGGTAKNSEWYLALFSGNVTPLSTWTAANFTANATEITSLTEGYSNATRPVWTPSPAAAGVISNVASKAAFSIVCASTITVYGAALLSSSARGGTTGVLASASRFASPRVLSNGDTFELGYEVELTDS